MLLPRNKTIKSLFEGSLHILAWILLFIVNYQFVDNYRIKLDLAFHLIIWLTFAVVFYVNYLVLIPYLLFRRKFAIYIVASVILLTLCSFAKDYSLRKHHEKMTSELVKERSSQPGMNAAETGQITSHKESRHRRDKRIFMFSGLLLFYTASLSIRFIQKWQNDEKNQSAIEKEKISTELSYLKQQINPHFLFNALNNIYSMTINSSPPASDAILKLSSILRFMLYQTENRQVQLIEEINIIRDYIALQKLRLTEKVTIAFSIDGDPEQLKIAPLILIPLIENAFKHGIDNVNESFIEIRMHIAEKTFEMKVANKIVRSSNGPDKNSGIGTRNIRRRLDLLYGDKYVFEISQKDNVFSVLLKLKLSL